MKAAAIAIILNEDKTEVVLIKRRDVPLWVLPGGGIDEGETPAEAAVREALEETGATVQIVRQVAEYTPINRLASQTYTFECRVENANFAIGDETLDVRFFPLIALPKALFFLHREWLEDALKNAPTLIYRPIDQITYWNVFKYFCKHPSHVLRILCARLGFPLNTKD